VPELQTVGVLGEAEGRKGVLMQIALCRSCEAPIIWTITATGSRMPVDAKPGPNGTIVLFERDGKVRSASIAGRGSAFELFTSHFATCPQATTRRKR
jgi:hypothetical protein